MRKFFQFAGIFGMAGLCATACFAEVGAELQKDLLAYLPLRTDLEDHSAAKNPVTLNGNVELRDGGAYFNGSTNWLILPYIDFHNKPFAVSMWVKTTGRNAMYGLIEQKAANAPGRWLHLMLRGGRQPYLGFYINDAISPQEIPLGRWVQLVFQFDGSHQQLWIDGQLLCSRKARAYQGNAGETVIGRTPRWNNVPSKDFEGYLREIRIYGRALSRDEIATLFETEKDSSVTGIVKRSGARSPDAPFPETQAVEFGIPFLDINGGKLVITGEARQVYDVLVTSDVSAEWQPLVTLTNKSGRVEYTDPQAAVAAQRFYRIRVK